MVDIGGRAEVVDGVVGDGGGTSKPAFAMVDAGEERETRRGMPRLPLPLDGCVALVAAFVR